MTAAILPVSAGDRVIPVQGMLGHASGAMTLMTLQSLLMKLGALHDPPLCWRMLGPHSLHPISCIPIPMAFGEQEVDIPSPAKPAFQTLGSDR